jgi:hypothetical protein
MSAAESTIVECDAPGCHERDSLANAPEWRAKWHFRGLGWAVITTPTGPLCYCPTHRHLGARHFYSMQGSPKGVVQ